jgi:hypothetical protein
MFADPVGMARAALVTPDPTNVQAILASDQTGTDIAGAQARQGGIASRYPGAYDEGMSDTEEGGEPKRENPEDEVNDVAKHLRKLLNPEPEVLDPETGKPAGFGAGLPLKFGSHKPESLTRIASATRYLFDFVYDIDWS